MASKKGALAAYIAEDAQRWFAVHARITGLSMALVEITSQLADITTTERHGIMGDLLHLKLTMEEQKHHPAAIAEVEKLIEALDPKQGSKKPNGGPKR